MMTEDKCNKFFFSIRKTTMRKWETLESSELKGVGTWKEKKEMSHFSGQGDGRSSALHGTKYKDEQEEEEEEEKVRTHMWLVSVCA